LEEIIPRPGNIEFPGDKINSVIINETFVKEYGLNSPVGSVLNGYKFNDEPLQVIGVIQDYNLQSLRSTVQPLILHITDEVNGNWSLMVKIRSDDISKTIVSLERLWQETVTDRDFSYTFLDDDLRNKYQSEDRWQKITGISTLIAFIISSLGLLGLALITINLRIKEIGIRKVLGASVSSIASTLTKDFFKWILIANLIAWPLTWFIMNKWLGNYAYRIQIQWWTFFLAGSLTIIIAGITISYQVIRTANKNPVKSLRYE